VLSIAFIPSDCLLQEARLADEAAAGAALRARLAALEATERGAAAAECERLRAALAEAQAARDHALNLLESLKVGSVASFGVSLLISIKVGLVVASSSLLQPRILVCWFRSFSL
jgi:hypothetical protein